jgi:NADH dehydrogenase/NADH:ubiquinone oxidoreductase subunit G
VEICTEFAGVLSVQILTIMKKSVFLVAVLLLSLSASSQLTVSDKCGAINLDVLDGKINGMRPNRDLNEFKKALPCFTSADEENSSAACGAALYYKDKDFVLYTDRDYFEFYEKTKVKLSIPLMGAKKGSLFNHLGNPKLKDGNWEAYQTSYGILVVFYSSAGTINRVIISTQSAETIQVCEKKPVLP